jgi:uncharacterized protein
MSKPELSADELAWLDSYRAELDERYGGLISRVIVFGSKARGDADEDSDLDLLVIIEDGDWRLKWDIADIAYRLALGTDVVPSMQIYTTGEWQTLARRRSVFRDAVERDGVPVG